ncbi:GntR family transcriptional regulator [Arthrobacter sp. MI7-26]|uniref:GntR family transcriptional regulator n=1 Tax=Arthrobacter sp. MI7-26 TaxID=2993653 RepID=UPI0022499EDC|nr:GntR family transcriptional regulator [Arthrobacter sp. MI7-26]MCX2749001.1 GntR family transcriptional regulator [Arthrobacter sp. MI7-26]
MVSRGKVASRRIADSIHSAVLTGELAPGQRIRQEEIAEQFGASRLPVREALRILESEGLVTLKANSGAWVSKLNLEECVEIYKIRECIEPLLLAESIPNLTDETVSRLETLMHSIEADDDIEKFLRLDREFHLLTYEGASMPSMHSMVVRFWNTTQQYRRAFTGLMGRERRWIIESEHRLLVEAIWRRDVEEAQRVLLGHIRRTRLELANHPHIFSSP